MFNSIDICSFIPVIGCVGMGPRALICPGAYNAVKMALHPSALLCPGAYNAVKMALI